MRCVGEDWQQGGSWEWRDLPPRERGPLVWYGTQEGSLIVERISEKISETGTIIYLPQLCQSKSICIIDSSMIHVNLYNMTECNQIGISFCGKVPVKFIKWDVQYQMLDVCTGENGESHSPWQWMLGCLVGKPSCLFFLSSIPSGPIVICAQFLYLKKKWRPFNSRKEWSN